MQISKIEVFQTWLSWFNSTQRRQMKSKQELTDVEILKSKVTKQWKESGYLDGLKPVMAEKVFLIKDNQL